MKIYFNKSSGNVVDESKLTDAEKERISEVGYPPSIDFIEVDNFEFKDFPLYRIVNGKILGVSEEQLEKEHHLDSVRVIRNQLLLETDSLMFLSDRFSNAEFQDLKTWREALRNTPSTINESKLTNITLDFIPSVPNSLKEKIGKMGTCTAITLFISHINNQS